MRTKNDYFAMAEENLMTDRFLNADGWGETLDASGSESWEYADASSEMGGMQPYVADRSTPYYLTVTNSSTNSISNVIIGNSYANRTEVNQGNNAAITITSGYSGFTYLGFLGQSEAQPFKVGMTYLNSSNTTLVSGGFTLTHRDQNGLLSSRPFVSFISPNQYQTTAQEIWMPYTFDGYSSLTITTFPASATLTIAFYLQDKINWRNPLAGSTAQKSYATPMVGAPQRVVLGSKVVSQLKRLA